MQIGRAEKTHATTTARKVVRPAERASQGSRRSGEAQHIAPESDEGVIDQQIRTVERAPHDVCPARAVPQATEQHRDEQVHMATGRAFAITAERDVQDSRAGSRDSGHVPAPPEIDDASSPCRGREKFTGSTMPNRRDRPIAMSE